jgi:hypothetical protein
LSCGPYVGARVLRYFACAWLLGGDRLPLFCAAARLRLHGPPDPLGTPDGAASRAGGFLVPPNGLFSGYLDGSVDPLDDVRPSLERSRTSGDAHVKTHSAAESLATASVSGSAVSGRTSRRTLGRRDGLEKVREAALSNDSSKLSEGWFCACGTCGACVAAFAAKVSVSLSTTQNNYLGRERQRYFEMLAEKTALAQVAFHVVVRHRFVP